MIVFDFFFQAEDGIRDVAVTGVQTCALPISRAFMENLTHTLAGVALSQVGFNRKTRYATLAMAIGANLPDVDLVTRFAGSTVFLKYHRGITHSFLGVSVLAALLAGTFFFLGRRAQPAKNSPPLDGRWLLAGCWLATASHLLLDFTNSYGVRPFLPFSGKWYAWGIVFIVDTVLLEIGRASCRERG